MAETLQDVTIDQISDEELAPHITSNMDFPPWFYRCIYFPIGEIYSSRTAITVPLHIMSAPLEGWAQISGQHSWELRTGLNCRRREDCSRFLHTHAIFYLPVSLKIVTWARVSLAGTYLGQVIQPMHSREGLFSQNGMMACGPWCLFFLASKRKGAQRSDFFMKVTKKVTDTICLIISSLPLALW